MLAIAEQSLGLLRKPLIFARPDADLRTDAPQGEGTTDSVLWMLDRMGFL